MNSGKFGMFDEHDIRESMDTLMASPMAFNPFVIWGAGAALGFGALAGLGRAVTETAFRRGTLSVTANESGLAFKSGVSDPGHRKVSPGDAPVEALARPILNEMIEQAIVAEKATPSKARKPGAKQMQAVPQRPSGLEKPRAGKADDLKRISGIGPKLELTLNDLGIYHFDQITGWGKAEIEWIDDYLSFKGRVERDKWIEQAKDLA